MTDQQLRIYNAWMHSFPARVWDDDRGPGWASRPATRKDWDRRREFAREKAEAGAEVAP